MCSEAISFEIEAYWGTPEGVLMHGTIYVEADSMEEALELARTECRIPPNSEDHDTACARPEYFEDHYDVEPIGDEFDEIRCRENHKTVMNSLQAMS